MKTSLSPVWQLITINYKEFMREPGILFWSLAFPVLMAWVLGIAFTKKTESVETIAWVSSRTMNTPIDTYLTQHGEGIPGAAGFQTSIENKLGKTIFRVMQVSDDSAILMLKRGETTLIIREQGDSLVYLFDPQSSDARYTYAMFSAMLHGERLAGDTAEISVLTQLGTRYVDFLIPGLLALGIMNGFLWGIGYSLIEIRTKKLLRRMVAAPMKKWHFIFASFVARFSLSSFEAAILYLFSWWYFRIQIQGSLAAFILVFLAGSFCFGGIALLMASRTASSRVGNALINLITMPMMVLSGVFFSYHNFPEAVIPAIRKLPLTLLADSLRSIMTEGTGIGDNLPAILILSLTGLVFFVVGIRIYRWY